MTPKIKLYMFNGSAPSMSARLMLEHKRLEYKSVHLLVGPHAFGMLGRGFVTMTVPALKIDGRRIQGSREISRALDELVPHAPLFPADPVRRQAVEDAERWGESFQDATRRLLLCASRLDPRTFTSVYRHANPLMRPVQRVARGLVIRLASAGHRATDRAAQEDLAALPACLDKIDAWIEDGLLNGPELNAADFQVAPNIALLLRFEDLAPLAEGRPAARLAQRLAPQFPGEIGAVLPSQWLTPIRAAHQHTVPPGPMGPRTCFARSATTISESRPCRTSPMAEHACVHCELALTCSDDTISGTIDDHSGQVLQFSGWLELMSAFDTVCARSDALRHEDRDGAGGPCGPSASG